MSGERDYSHVRSKRAELDDDSIEALFHGEQVPREFETLATAVRAIRASGRRPPVGPSPELSERMARGDFSDVPQLQQSRIGKAMQRLARMGFRAKAASALAVGVTGLSGVTAAGALPDAAQERVEHVVEAVMPVEFPDRTEFGQEIADDARDRGAGVIGEEVSEDAKDQGSGTQPTTRQPTHTPPVTLPDVVPTDPPGDAPRATPSATPPVDPPRDDTAEDRPTPKPDTPPKPPRSKPDNPNNDHAPGAAD